MNQPDYQSIVDLKEKIKVLEQNLTNIVDQRQKDTIELQKIESLKTTNQKLEERVKVLENNLTNVINQRQEDTIELQKIEDLKEKVEELKENLTNVVNQRKNDVTELQKIEGLQDTNKKLEERVEELKANHEQQLKDLQKSTERIGHRESGDMIQPAQNGPVLRGSRGYIEKRRDEKFKKPFSKVPKIIISWNMTDNEYSKNLRLTAKAEKITVDGFEFAVGTWHDSILHGFHATWTAYED